MTDHLFIFEKSIHKNNVLNHLDRLTCHIFSVWIICDHGNNKDLYNAEYLDNIFVWVKTQRNFRLM